MYLMQVTVYLMEESSSIKLYAYIDVQLLPKCRWVYKFVQNMTLTALEERQV